jgi:protein ImuA
MQPATAPSTHNVALSRGGVQHALDVLPVGVERLMWRGTELGRQLEAVQPSGWEALDRELPGGGWPTRSVTELLTAQPAVLEWRLLGPALRSATSLGGQVVVIGPPRTPHVPGLLHEGLHEKQLVWIQAEAPAERLWVTEQVIKSNAAGAVVAWLPQARQEQIRRLQVCAQGFEGLVFLCRAQSAKHEASAAPLRLEATVGLDWELRVHVFKRRGPAHDSHISLASVPGGLASVLTPRLMKPSVLLHRTEEATHAVGLPAAISRRQRTPA